jgi:hypothetical protein
MVVSGFLIRSSSVKSLKISSRSRIFFCFSDERHRSADFTRAFLAISMPCSAVAMGGSIGDRLLETNGFSVEWGGRNCCGMMGSKALLAGIVFAN